MRKRASKNKVEILLAHQCDCFCCSTQRSSHRVWRRSTARVTCKKPHCYMSNLRREYEKTVQWQSPSHQIFRFACAWKMGTWRRNFRMLKLFPEKIGGTDFASFVCMKDIPIVGDLVQVNIFLYDRERRTVLKQMENRQCLKCMTLLQCFASCVILEVWAKNYLICQGLFTRPELFVSLSKRTLQKLYDQRRVSGVRRHENWTNLLAFYRELS